MAAKTEALIAECRDGYISAIEKASNRRERDAALFTALARAIRIHRLAEKFTIRAKKLEKAFDEHQIKESKDKANEFTRILKLCIPGRTTNDYYRYASALYYFELKRWSPEKIESQLEERSLAHFTDLGRKRRGKKKEGLARPRGGPSDLAKRQLRSISLLGKVDAESDPFEDEWVVLIGRKSDLQQNQIDVLSPINCSEAQYRSLLSAYARQAGLKTTKATSQKRGKKAYAKNKKSESSSADNGKKQLSKSSVRNRW